MKVIKFENLELHIDHRQTIPTREVAQGYGVSEQTIRDHKNRHHSDEILKNIHYIEVWDEKFKRYVTRWTLEGVHMLGFFIKSERAKEFRKFTAKLLTEIKKGNVQVSAMQHCPASDNLNRRINGYKGMLARKQKEIDKLRFKLAIYQDEIRSLKEDKKRAIECAKTFDKLYEKEKKTKEALDLFTKLSEHNLLDLIGQIARQEMELANLAKDLASISKTLEQRSKNTTFFLEQFKKYYHKAEAIIKT